MRPAHHSANVIIKSTNTISCDSRKFRAAKYKTFTVFVKYLNNLAAVMHLRSQCHTSTLLHTYKISRNLSTNKGRRISLDTIVFRYQYSKFVRSAHHLATASIGGGSYWAGRAAARPLFRLRGPQLCLARPLLAT